MKKIIIFLMLSLVMVSSVNALSLSYTQNDNLVTYTENDKGNNMLFSVAGNINDVISVINASTNRTYDLDFEMTDINEDFYLVFENYFENSTLTLLWRGDLNADSSLYSQNFTLNAQGRYYFKFSPDTSNELGKVYIDYESGQASNVIFVEYVEEKPRGFNDLMVGFVEGFETVIDYNLGLWAILFYTVITLIATGFILFLFGLAFMMFAYARRIRDEGGIRTLFAQDKED